MGEVELTESLTNYSKINGVSKSKMCELATGKLTYYRGYAVTILRENTR